jgi:nucleotide-binding universal stress UspA family protein
MIVVGARGSGPLDELSVGSVTRGVVHHSTVPVLVVRASAEQDTRDRFRVLLASDGSSSSKHACDVIKNFSWPARTVGRVITVVEPPLAGHLPKWLEAQLEQQEVDALGIGSFEQTQEEQKLVREGLADLCGELPAIFQGHEPIVAVGHASQEILKAIRAEKIDLVVVGARGLGLVGRFVLGSTSEHLLAHAPCSVLIAREHEKP